MIFALDACACSRKDEKSGVLMRMLHAAQHLAARCGDDGRRVAFERGAERVIRGQEKPRVAASPGQRLPRPVREHIGVIGEGDRVGRACLSGQVRRSAAGIHQHHVLFLDHIADGQRDTGIRRVGDHVDLLDVSPLPRDAHADIRLVLVVAEDDVNGPALVAQARILDRHRGGHHAVGAADIGIKAGLIVQDTDLDVFVLRRGGGRSRRA